MTTDPVLERVAWALVIAVVGLVVREAWQAWRARQDSRKRDQLVLSALLREVLAIRGLAASQAQNLQREAEVLREQSRWLLKPLVSLPTTAYDLVRDHPPQSFLKQERALVDLMRLQAHCAYTNSLTGEFQRWKAPAARGQPDQLEVIATFHAPILEAVNFVLERCDRLVPAIRDAGKAVGGLNLQGPSAG